MFLYFDWVGACQPLTNDVGPTKSHSQQSQKFFKTLTLCDDELGQEVATSFIPSYSFTKRSLQTANVSHQTVTSTRNV